MSVESTQKIGKLRDNLDEAAPFRCLIEVTVFLSFQNSEETVSTGKIVTERNRCLPFCFLSKQALKQSIILPNSTTLPNDLPHFRNYQRRSHPSNNHRVSYCVLSRATVCGTIIRTRAMDE